MQKQVTVAILIKELPPGINTKDQNWTLYERKIAFDVMICPTLLKKVS